MANDFVHLHTHSEYSLLDGLGRIKKLVAEAKRLGQPALALTDHGVMHGAIEFFRACKAAEIKPIIGVEAYQTAWGRPMGGRDAQFDRDNYHLLLLAKNMTGYRNLLKIGSNSHLNGYYYRPRVDHEFLAAHAEGLVATTGCLGAEVPQLLNQGKENEAYERLGWYVDVFGKENFFIELQEHNIPELIPVNKTLVPVGRKIWLAAAGHQRCPLCARRGWRPARRVALCADGRQRRRQRPHADERRQLFSQEPRTDGGDIPAFYRSAGQRL